MKILIFFLISISLLGVDKERLNRTVRDASQKVITQKGYTLIKEQEFNKVSEKINSECLDDNCLIDTGKILSASFLFKIKIEKLKASEFIINLEAINLKTTKKKKYRIRYNGKLDNYLKIYKSVERLTGVIKKIDKKSVALLKIELPKIKTQKRDKVDRFVTSGNKKRMEKSLRKIKKTLRSAAEQTITSKNFTILEQSIQEEALAQQTNDGDENCLDDSCLIDTGKMLAASRIFIVKISPLGKGQYLFKITHTNLETNEMIKSQSEIYTKELDDYSALFNFGRKFFKTIFQDEEIQTGNKIPIMLKILIETKKADEDDLETVLLEIKTPFDPVTVYHGGETFGITPLTVKVPKGTYLLKFEKKGYDTAEMKYELTKDSKLFFKKLYTNGGPYPVTFKTLLPSKFNYKDQKGDTPKTIYLKKGKHQISLENNIAGLKEFNVEVTTAETFNFKMNRGFSYLEISPNFEFWYQSFDWVDKPTYLLLGIKARFFVWNWKYFDVDILGGGFSLNMQLDKNYSWQFHLLEFNIKPTEYLTINFNIGPLGGNVTRFYYSNEINIDGDRIEYAMTLAGTKITYKYTILRILALSLYSGIYWGNHSNKDSLFTTDSKDVNYGWLLNLGLKAEIKF